MTTPAQLQPHRPASPSSRCAPVKSHRVVCASRTPTQLSDDNSSVEESPENKPSNAPLILPAITSVSSNVVSDPSSPSIMAMPKADPAPSLHSGSPSTTTNHSNLKQIQELSKVVAEEILTKAKVKLPDS